MPALLLGGEQLLLALLPLGLDRTALLVHDLDQRLVFFAALRGVARHRAVLDVVVIGAAAPAQVLLLDPGVDAARGVVPELLEVRGREPLLASAAAAAAAAA